MSDSFLALLADLCTTQQSAFPLAMFQQQVEFFSQKLLNLFTVFFSQIMIYFQVVDLEDCQFANPCLFCKLTYAVVQCHNCGSYSGYLVNQLELLHHCNITGMAAGWRIQYLQWQCRAGSRPAHDCPCQDPTLPREGCPGGGKRTKK